MACEKMVIHGVRAAQITTLTNELVYNKFTVQITPSGYFIEGKGIKGSVVYNLMSQTLTIDIFKKPWYVTCGRVRSTIQKFLNKK